MIDHSKRVSPRENVVAFYAWAGRRRDRLVTWVAARPLHRFLRGRSVSTMLGVAGVVLSITAVLLVIGVGQTTIVASEQAGHHKANLFANGWFDAGLFVAGVGIFIAMLAVAANGSQATALRGFPDLVIRVRLRSNFSAAEPAYPEGSGQAVTLAHARLLIVNNERGRDVTLDVGLSLATQPGAFDPVPFGNITAIGFVPTSWTPAFGDLPEHVKVMGLRPLTFPLHVPAETQMEGDAFFAITAEQIDKLDFSARGRLSATDLRTGRFVEFEYGYPHDAPLT